MVAIANPEAVARAVVERRAAPLVTDEQKRAGEIKKLMTEQNPRSVIESISGKKPIDQQRVENALQKNIAATGRDPVTKEQKRTPAEDKRYKDGKTKAEAARTYIEKGYDGLSSSQKKDVTILVSGAIKASWPDAAKIFNGPPPLPDAEVEATVRELLEKPELRDKIHTLLEAATDPSKALSQDALNNARLKFEQKKLEHEQKGVDVKEKNNELTTVTDELDKYKPGEVKQKQLEKLTKDYPANQAKVAAKQTELAHIQAQITGLEQARQMALRKGDMAEAGRIALEIKGFGVTAVATQKELTEAETNIQKKADLEAEKATLTTQKRQIEAAKAKLELEERKLETERFMAQAEVDNAKLVQAASEQDFVDGIKNVFGDATREFLQEQAVQAEAAQRTLIEREIQQATNDAEKTMLEQMLERWDKEQLGRFNRNPYKKKQVNADYKTLLDRSQGPNAIMRDMLIQSGMPASEANEWMNNPDFVTKMQPQVTERLLTRRIQTGGITPREAEVIIQSDWGEGMIQKAIAGKKEIQTAVDALIADGSLQGNWWEKPKGAKALTLLMVLLGIVTVGIVPLAKYALKS